MLGRGGDRSLLIGDEGEISRRRERVKHRARAAMMCERMAQSLRFRLPHRSKSSNILAHFSFAA
jgi:uncharacterized membrane-anchored protein YhcB (DUF1043 family)